MRGNEQSCTDLQDVVIFSAYCDSDLLRNRHGIRKVFVGKLVKLFRVICTNSNKDGLRLRFRDTTDLTFWDNKCVTFGQGSDVQEGEPGNG